MHRVLLTTYSHTLQPACASSSFIAAFVNFVSAGTTNYDAGGPKSTLHQPRCDFHCAFLCTLLVTDARIRGPAICSLMLDWR